MPLTIQTNAITGTAFMIPQEYTVRTLRGRRVGTSSMFGCMGLVIHSPLHHIGCLAHIEAVVTTAIFQTYVVYMISKIIKYGGADPGLQVGIFGNAGGSGDAALTRSLKDSLVAAGVRATEITDQRNRNPGGVHHDAGANARINGGFFSIAYTPGTGVVDCYPAGMPAPIPVHDANTTGIRRKKLQ